MMQISPSSSSNLNALSPRKERAVHCVVVEGGRGKCHIREGGRRGGEKRKYYVHSKPLTEGRRRGGEYPPFCERGESFSAATRGGKGGGGRWLFLGTREPSKAAFSSSLSLSVVYIALTELFLDPSSSGYGKKGTIGEKGIIGGNICACLPFPHCSYVRTCIERNKP